MKTLVKVLNWILFVIFALVVAFSPVAQGQEQAYYMGFYLMEVLMLATPALTLYVLYKGDK